jgi:hypothetical protein
VDLYVNGNPYRFPAGMPSRGIETTINLGGGRVTSYPFDQVSETVSTVLLICQNKVPMFNFGHYFSVVVDSTLEHWRSTPLSPTILRQWSTI